MQFGGELQAVEQMQRPRGRKELPEFEWPKPHHGEESGEVGLANLVMELKLYFKCYEKPLGGFEQGIMG